MVDDLLIVTDILTVG